MTVPIYTVAFSTKQSPFDYTLSNIGNLFDHNTSFIFWGVVTGACLALYLFYTFKKLGYKDKKARRYLVASNVCLFLTVITPAAKDIMPFFHFMHVVYSGLFALFLISAIALFIKYFTVINKRFGKLAHTLFLSTIAVPILTLFFMGLNGVVEILFFVCISMFLIILNIILKIVDNIPEESPDSEEKSTTE